MVAGAHEQPIPPSYKTRNWPTGKRGRQPECSGAAVQTRLLFKVFFGMAFRQTTGFVESLLRLLSLDWAVPDYGTLSRCQKTLAVNIPYRGSQGPLNLLIDSAGITLEIQAIEITGSQIGDAPMLPELLDQIPPGAEIGSVTADGAYDTCKCHDTVAGRGAHITGLCPYPLLP